MRLIVLDSQGMHEWIFPCIHTEFVTSLLAKTPHLFFDPKDPEAST